MTFEPDEPTRIERAIWGGAGVALALVLVLALDNAGAILEFIGRCAEAVTSFFN